MHQIFDVARKLLAWAPANACECRESGSTKLGAMLCHTDFCG
jgi:hypothetical protein